MTKLEPETLLVNVERTVGVLAVLEAIFGEEPETIIWPSLLLALSKGMATLREKESQALILRFGLLDGRPRTLKEVGVEMSLTPERIRQLEAKALRKLRHPAHSRALRSAMVISSSWRMQWIQDIPRTMKEIEAELKRLANIFGFLLEQLTEDTLADALARAVANEKNKKKAAQDIEILRASGLTARTTNMALRLALHSDIPISALTDEQILDQRNLGAVALAEIRSVFPDPCQPSPIEPGTSSDV